MTPKQLGKSIHEIGLKRPHGNSHSAIAADVLSVTTSLRDSPLGAAGVAVADARTGRYTTISFCEAGSLPAQPASVMITPMRLDATMPAALLLPGFGDDASMFAPLTKTALADHYRLVPIDLPGFGGRPALEGKTSLGRLAEIVHRHAAQECARIVVAHSLSSIVASLAARRTPSAIDIILSLEGNLTAEDAYFSGTAADYSSAREFRAAFLSRLDVLATRQPIVARYRDSVARADPRALWELGCDARRFSDEHPPGEVLSESAAICYLYNPENCPASTLEWLRRSKIKRVRMANATHWKSVDQPELLSNRILQALQDLAIRSGA